MWGMKDLEYYRAIGLHYPHTPGSLIDWNKVEWERFDDGGAKEVVLRNLFREALR
jgi:hypothetical protein